MISVSKIYEAASKNENLKVDYYSPAFDRFGDKIYGEQAEIGFSLGRGVWYWFSVMDLAGSESMLFKQRYSQNNGKTQRGVKAEWRAEDIINNILK